MTFDVWQTFYNRLCAAKEHKKNPEQCRAYFDALEPYPDACVQAAVLKATREVTGWPKSDRLVDLARQEYQKVQAPADMCHLCHGTGFIDAPDEEHFNRMYTNYVRRCPQCRPAKVQGDVA